jgi:hypothetical protein
MPIPNHALTGRFPHDREPQSYALPNHSLTEQAERNPS